jgi:hypothetical protein
MSMSIFRLTVTAQLAMDTAEGIIDLLVNRVGKVEGNIAAPRFRRLLPPRLLAYQKPPRL